MEAPMRLGFVLVPGSSLMTFSCAREAFRLANECTGTALFDHAVIGVDEAPIAMDGGERVLPDTSLDRAPAFDVIFILSGLNVAEYRNARLEGWLRARSRTGAIIVPVGCATLLAARAGLLDGHRCVTHWTLYERFRAEFPKVRLVEGLFCIDGSVMTVAGGVAAFDLGLALVQRSPAAATVAHQAEIAIHHRPRLASEHQRAGVTWRYGVQDARLAKVIGMMESHLDQPVALPALAAGAGVSVRQLQRLCRHALGCGPRAFHRAIRLRRAQALLRMTRAPIAEIALTCGFADASHLTRSYRFLFGKLPSQERRGPPAESPVSGAE